MAEISATLVKELREATNVSMMECKRALEEAGGDKEKAMRILRERGLAVAAKKAGRAANQGLIASAVTADGKSGALAEVNCETDFVAKNESFQAFTRQLAQQALTVEDNGLAAAAKDAVVQKVAQIGENIVVRRNTRFAAQGAGRVFTYVHLGGKVAVMVEIGCGKPETAQAEAFAAFGKDITLHIAASSPAYLQESDVPAPVLQTERDIYAKQVTGKPPQIVEKIVDGKIKRYYTEVCLIRQPFVKDPKVSVTDVTAQCAKAVGDTVAIRRFIRWQLGE